MGTIDSSKNDVKKMEAEKNVEGLIKVLKSGKDNKIRESAAKALGNIGD